MEERRKIVRRAADRDMIMRLHKLENPPERRSKDEAGHLRRRVIRHECAVAISMRIGYSSGVLDTWSIESVKIPGRLLDMSVTGCALFTEQQFEINQELQLAIRVRSGFEIKTRANVRWVKLVPEKHGHASGVQFRDVSAKDEQRIAEFLVELDKSLGI